MKLIHSLKTDEWGQTCKTHKMSKLKQGKDDKLALN